MNISNVKIVIYKTTNLINNKIYVGKDCHNDPNYLGSGKIIKQALKKYGKNNFKKEILEECREDNWEEKEKYWIKELDSIQPKGYNIGYGGEGGDTLTNHPDIKEIGMKISQRFKGSGNPNYGKHPSDETKKKMSRLGMHHTEETKKLMSLKHKGKKKSIETRKRISLGRIKYWKKVHENNTRC